VAAKHRELDEFVRLLEALQAQVAEPKRVRWAVVYIHYVVEYRVHQILGFKPGLEDLKGVANQYSAEYAHIINAGKIMLLDLLCTVFEIPNPGGEWITGPEFGGAGAAAIGVMLDDPAQQLTVIRPHLAAWCSRYANTLSEMGLPE